METLTKKEEEIMQILWQIKEGFVNDIIKEMEEEKPPYNTISSIVRILEKKGFVDFKSFGKSHMYFPIISKAAYKKHALKKLISGYFDGSYEKVVSFIANEEVINDEEMEEIIKLKKIIENKNNDK
ncbi:MAG: BlaI/MecI/CopY family transcriptional regulator [Bacteroidales bacterium]|nr:BlaI/MecI/CopY family transcriptional regulator [Bacteroidales bacterium]MBN2758234.1 BlaI/MecI/CopY family transcriptional regulator [Bacteroidales bacterium]